MFLLRNNKKSFYFLFHFPLNTKKNKKGSSFFSFCYKQKSQKESYVLVSLNIEVSRRSYFLIFLINPKIPKDFNYFSFLLNTKSQKEFRFLLSFLNFLKYKNIKRFKFFHFLSKQNAANLSRYPTSSNSLVPLILNSLI